MKDTYKSVLIIEDDEIDIVIYEMVIKSIGFAENIIIRKTVEGAMNYLKKAGKGEEEIPEIILLDLFMPLESGFEFLTQFETLPDSIKKNSKIAVITHSSDENDEMKSRENKNVSYFIDKPLTMENLNILRKLYN